MGTYMGHIGPVLSCMWSPLKPQLIMTGSSDFTLHVWNYTLPEQSPKQLSDIKGKKKKGKKKKKNSKTANNENNETVPNPVNEVLEETQSNSSK
ncbi:gem-associated protein 5-like [Monomorium pharaonis]|uniref:gem-associated protein 5-like n=1 Tax=Monomorium pharaonis TaxID=307658 RepID=UPI001746768C|nr:gem-associated protein 5-like [Monomorium pharaonis]